MNRSKVGFTGLLPALRRGGGALLPLRAKPGLRAEPGPGGHVAPSRRLTLVPVREAGSPLARLRDAGRRHLFLLAVGLPTVLAGLYYGLLASDIYVSEARVVVRNAAKPVGAGLSSFLEMAGMARSSDDSHVVSDFVLSRDALAGLEAVLPMREIWGRAGIDLYARFPAPWRGSSEEELYRYYLKRVAVEHSTTTGVTTLKVEAFRAEDSAAIAKRLLQMSEEVVNRLNRRSSDDALSTARAEVTRAEERVVATQEKVTAFRIRELNLDPGKSSTLVTELIGKLNAELAQAKAQLASTLAAAPASPAVQPLRRRIAAVEEQIAEQRERTRDADAFARQVAEYESLQLQREFATKALAGAFAAQETARVEARRQQLYLERVVEPRAADAAQLPDSLASVATIAVGAALIYLMLWIVANGLRQHSYSDA